MLRLLAMAGLCLTLPFGLGEGAVLQVREMFSPLGAKNPWPDMEAAISRLPLVSSGFVALLLLLLFVSASGWIKRYRFRNTWVHGEPLDYRSGCNPLAGWLSLCFIAISWGLATPWVLSWSRRRLYGRCHTPHGPLGFSGGGLAIAWYGLITLLFVPLGFVTLGLAWFVPRYLWLSWEQDNLVVPDVGGEPCETEWEGSMLGFGAFVAVRWLLTVFTLGLLHPWALTATWRWAAERTRFTPKTAAASAE
jgi:hypothetical protein